MANNNSENGENESSDKPHSANRRRFLSGMGAGAFFALNGVPSGATKKIDIVAGLKRGEEFYTRVNADWWNDVQHVESVHEKRKEAITNTKGVQSVSITGSNETIGNRSKFQLRITHAKGNQARRKAKRAIGEEVDNVPVTYSEMEKDQPQNCPLKTGKDPVPGSVVVTEESGLSGDGSLTARAYYEPEDEYVMVTAAHVLGDACGTNINGTTARNNAGEIGDVIAYDAADDWAAIDDSGLLDLSDSIISSRGNLELDGIYTSYQTLIDEERTIYHSGIATNHKSGVVDDYKVSANVAGANSCITLSGEGVRFDFGDEGTARGDSGGPHYLYSGDGNPLLIAQLNVGNGSDVGTAECNGNEVTNISKGVSSARLFNSGFRFWK